MFHRCRFRAMFSAVVFHQVTGHTVTTVNGQRCTGNVLRMLPLYRMLRIDSMMEHDMQPAACTSRTTFRCFILLNISFGESDKSELPSPFLGHE
jgi:hypothetical protein